MASPIKAGWHVSRRAAKTATRLYNRYKSKNPGAGNKAARASKAKRYKEAARKLTENRRRTRDRLFERAKDPKSNMSRKQRLAVLDDALRGYRKGQERAYKAKRSPILAGDLSAEHIIRSSSVRHERDWLASLIKHDATREHFDHLKHRVGATNYKRWAKQLSENPPAGSRIRLNTGKLY